MTRELNVRIELSENIFDEAPSFDIDIHELEDEFALAVLTVVDPNRTGYGCKVQIETVKPESEKK